MWNTIFEYADAHAWLYSSDGAMNGFPPPNSDKSGTVTPLASKQK